MKVARKPAQPWDGKNPLPHKLAVAIAEGRAKVPDPSPAIFPVCEMVQWRGHGQFRIDPAEDVLHSRVVRFDHPSVSDRQRIAHLNEAARKGLDPDLCGHCENMAGHPRFVEPGDHLVQWPDGLIHHGNETGKDLRSYYDAVLPDGKRVPLPAPEAL